MSNFKGAKHSEEIEITEELPSSCVSLRRWSSVFDAGEGLDVFLAEWLKKLLGNF